jgi:streptogramin lyase
MLVSDHTTGDIVIYDLSGAEVAEVGTHCHRYAAGIMGIKVGPDGRIWYVNATTHALVRLDPALNVGVSDVAPTNTLRLHPNPATDRLYVMITGAATNGTRTVQVMDAAGRSCLQQTINDLRQGIDVSALANGTYVLRIDGGEAQRFIVTR